MADRTILRVPFAEKDQAKALGARWDPTAYVWWIPSNLDLARFQRWAPRPTTAPIPVFEAPAVRYMDFGQLNAQLALPALTVFFGKHLCWRCHQESWLIDLWCHDDIDPSLADDSDDVYFQMQATLDTGFWPAMIPAFTAARKALTIPALGTIKDRFHQTAGQPLLSQGCAHCDAPFGDFFNREYWMELWTANSPTTYPFKSSLPWPVQEAAETAERLRIQETTNLDPSSGDPASQSHAD